MGKYFGTDGIRSVANKEMNLILINKIGFALANILLEKNDRPKVIIGKDTRISSDMIECALASSLTSQGVDVVLIGISPTPCVSFLTKNNNFSSGIMISASHNSYEYNGIKIFDENGFKLSDNLEEKIEYFIDNPVYSFDKAFNKIGKIHIDSSLKNIYTRYIKNCVNIDKTDFKIAIDCSNGSASFTAYDIFNDISDNIHIVNCSPDGVNINNNCGSTNISFISNYVKENKCDFGIAFDGDADRCLFVDSTGEPVDGDFIVCEIAKYLKSINKLVNNTVVLTIMTNLGILNYLKQNNIDFEITNVGDRYVLENMVKNNHIIGGEQSGHIILKDFMITGDGQLSALFFISVLDKLNLNIDEIKTKIKTYFQVMKNVRIKNENKNLVFENYDLQLLVKQYEQELSNSGRILVRVSGTEPLIRVMVECIEKDKAEQICFKISDFIEKNFY